MLATQSCRGTLRDTTHHRRFVVPIIYFLIIFSLFELLFVVFTIFLIGYDNNFSFDFDQKHIVESISDATECKNVDEVDQKSRKMSIRKKNGIVLVILFLQIFLFLANGLVKILYYTELLLWLARLFNQCVKVVCCCCRGKISLLEEVGELMKEVFHKDTFPMTDGIAGLCYIYSETGSRGQDNQMSLKDKTGKS
jgi:hypothetical protein